MKRFSIFLLLHFFCLSINAQSQNQIDAGKSWNWVVPLKTHKTEIEKEYGESVTKDKKSLFQTYVAAFGKITAVYAGEKEFIQECSCTLQPGTVIKTFVSPQKLNLTELNFDLKTFEKNDTFSPREISYYSEREGILITTEIIELEDKTKLERVISIEYRPSQKLCASAQCQKRIKLGINNKTSSCAR